MRKTNLKDCKAETHGHCSFECINCCYDNKESLKHFRYLYYNQIN